MPLRWNIAQAAEIRWWKSYLRNKPVHDYLSWKTNYWRDFLKTIGVSPTSGMTILDAGCGPAGIFSILNGQDVTAVDPLLEKYEDQLDHFRSEDYHWTTFVASPLEEFIEPVKFDLIFCLNAINHVKDIDLCLSNLETSLKDGGTLVMSIDSHNHQAWKHLFRLLPGDILHPHQYDLEEYNQMLRNQQLTVQSTHHLKHEYFFDYYAIVARKP